MADDPSAGWKAVREMVSLFRSASPSTADSPGHAAADEKSIVVFSRAERLARSQPDDAAAVDELRSLAAQNQKTLRRAEKMSRVGGRHQQTEHGNRTHRLLEAAIHDRPVAPVSEAELLQIKMLEKAFTRDRPADEVWAELTAYEPRLQQVKDDVRAGKYGHRIDLHPDAEKVADPDYLRQRGEFAHGEMRMMARINELLGPKSGSDHPLIASGRAAEFALFHLLPQRPDLSTRPA